MEDQETLRRKDDYERGQRAEQIAALQRSVAEIKKALPYMGSNFALANNLNQPITLKYPTDTASIVLKETADEMVKIARRLRAM